MTTNEGVRNLYNTFRVETKISHADVAKRIGITGSYLSNFLTKKVEFNKNRLTDLRDVLLVMYHDQTKRELITSSTENLEIRKRYREVRKKEPISHKEVASALALPEEYLREFSGGLSVGGYTLNKLDNYLKNTRHERNLAKEEKEENKPNVYMSKAWLGQEEDQLVKLKPKEEHTLNDIIKEIEENPATEKHKNEDFEEDKYTYTHNTIVDILNSYDSDINFDKYENSNGMSEEIMLDLVKLKLDTHINALINKAVEEAVEKTKRNLKQDLGYFSLIENTKKAPY